jgi:hypothetical protein
MILLDLIILVIFGEMYKFWIYWFCSCLQLPIISSLLDPNILLSTVFSNTLSVFPSFNIRDQVSHPYETTGNIIFLYILVFIFSGRRREWMIANIIHRTESPLNFLVNQISICYGHSQVSELCHISEWPTHYLYILISSWILATRQQRT